MLKVVLVDDEQIILNGLLRVISWADYGCEVVGTAADGLEGVALTRQTRPDILFTDIRMPNMDGLKMVAALRSEFPRLQISVLTAYRDFDYAKQALHLGVARYLLKPSKMDELVEAIRFMADRVHSAREQAPVIEPESEEAASNFIVQQAIQYIHEHCAEHIHLSDVADHVYVSQWHLSKLIGKTLNQSFNELVNRARVDRAKELLKEPSLKIHEVADLVGFLDVAHFSKTFKRLTGKTPGEYRQRR